MDVPDQLKDWLGPIGWFIVVCIGGWVAKKVQQGGRVAYEFAIQIKDGHLHFLKEVSETNQNHSKILAELNAEAVANRVVNTEIRDVNQEICDKIKGWGSDLTMDAIRASLQSTLDEAIKSGKVKCNALTPRDIEVLLDRVLSARVNKQKPAQHNE